MSRRLFLVFLENDFIYIDCITFIEDRSPSEIFAIYKKMNVFKKKKTKKQKNMTYVSNKYTLNVRDNIL